MNGKVILNMMDIFQIMKYNGFGNLFINNILVYEGYFSEGKKNGKGLLYFNNIERIYFNGIFEMNNLVEGILYDLEGVKIYEGYF